MTKAFKESDNEQQEYSFQSTIQTIERNDKSNRKLRPMMMDLGAWIEQNDPPVKTIPLFNWLAGCDAVKHTKDGKTYYEITVPNGLLTKIFPHMTRWLDDNRIGTAALKAWHCFGVFIRINGKVEWQYPAYNRRDSAQPDITAMVHQAAENLQISF